MTKRPSPADRYLARRYAEKITSVDVEAFAWLFDLEFAHDSEAQDAKDMIVRALKEYGRADGEQKSNET